MNKNRNYVFAISINLLAVGITASVATGCNKGVNGSTTESDQICEINNCNQQTSGLVDEYLCYCDGERLSASTGYPGYLCGNHLQMEQSELNFDCETRCSAPQAGEAILSPCDVASTTSTTSFTSGGDDSITITTPTTSLTSLSESSSGEFPRCGDWTPDSEIQLFQGVYYVDGGFLSDIINDPSLLLVCDDARFTPLTTGGFQLDNADDGELLYELGLRNGDKPLELNGLALDTFDDAAVAFGLLFGETEYELFVQRGTTYVMLEFQVYYTL